MFKKLIFGSLAGVVLAAYSASPTNPITAGTTALTVNSSGVVQNTNASIYASNKLDAVIWHGTNYLVASSNFVYAVGTQGPDLYVTGATNNNANGLYSLSSSNMLGDFIQLIWTNINSYAFVNEDDGLDAFWQSTNSAGQPHFIVTWSYLTYPNPQKLYPAYDGQTNCYVGWTTNVVVPAYWYPSGFKLFKDLIVEGDLSASNNITASNVTASTVQGDFIGNGSGLYTLRYDAITNPPSRYGSFHAVNKRPPMFWSSYITGGSYTQPGETNLLNIASNLISSGAWAAGYRAIQIDEQWAWRSNATYLTYNSTNFPNGVKYVIDKLHEMQFKVGLYFVLKEYGAWDNGPGQMKPMTCRETLNDDIRKAIGEYGCDFIKFDGFLSANDAIGAEVISRIFYVNNYQDKWFNLTLHGNADGSPYVMNPDIAALAPAWEWTILQDFSTNLVNQLKVAYQMENASQYIGNGHWGQLFWASTIAPSAAMATNIMNLNVMWPSALYAGTTLSSGVHISLFTNKEINSIAQDISGSRHSIVYSNNATQIWTRPLSENPYGKLAVLFINGGTGTSNLTATADMLGLTSTAIGLKARDPWLQTQMADVFTNNYAVSIAAETTKLYVLNPIYAQSSLGITFDGQGSAIVTNKVGYLSAAYPCTITGWKILSDVPANMIVDVWKTSGAIPTSANTITGSVKPSSFATNYTAGSTLTGWTNTIAAGDVIGFNIISNSAATWSQIILNVIR